MKKIALVMLILIVSGCANLNTPKETNVAVSYLLDQIQIAINEIDKQTKGTSLPPFKSAEVKLTTKANITDEGSGTLVLSGGASKSSTDTNTITLELIPNPDKQNLTEGSTGLNIANYVIAAVTAVDDKNFLKLKTLTVEAGLQVIRKKNGGIEVELVGVTVKGGRTNESDNSHNLKLIFGQSK